MQEEELIVGREYHRVEVLDENGYVLHTVYHEEDLPAWELDILLDVYNGKGICVEKVDVETDFSKLYLN